MILAECGRFCNFYLIDSDFSMFQHSGGSVKSSGSYRSTEQRFYLGKKRAVLLTIRVKAVRRQDHL